MASSIEVVIDQGRLSLTLALDADQSDEERSSLVEFIETLRMMSEPESEDGEIRALEAGEPLGDASHDNGASEKPVRGPYVKWFEIMAQLVSGEIDEFETVKKAHTAWTTQAELVRKYPGCIVKIADHGDGYSTIKVTVGAYRG